MNKYAALRVVILSALAALLIGGAYMLTDRFLSDRMSAMSFRPPRPRPQSQRQSQSRTYSKKEIEEARRKGQMPAGQQQRPFVPPPNPAANDAAVQQSLRTLQEIERINQMNQRLLEQQQRMQNQNHR